MNTRPFAAWITADHPGVTITSHGEVGTHAYFCGCDVIDNLFGAPDGPGQWPITMNDVPGPQRVDVVPTR